MDKIFEISTNSVKVSNLSLEEYTNLFKQEKENIKKYLEENFSNPERMTYFNFKIDYGKMGHPYWQTLFMDKGDEQFERSYDTLKESKNFEKAIGYKIFIREQSTNPKEGELSYSAFGEIEFLFDEELTNELKEADRKLAEDVMRFYADSRSNYRGD